jgi:predicted ATP-dependent endonuclease of OLD family
MKLRRLEIENFRGIKTLTWNVGPGVTCLIGAGDSTKSSVLEAIHIVLWPRWAVTIDDSDFYRVITKSGVQGV